uniref:ATP synthase subunit b, chloroplastic n=1 Tax=Botryococcus braunii TaxID=38881 RepID=A0A097KQ29_BOTBR|nr:CF0 subunit I of ATP synthase [Botryococcus braunii]AIT95309.1 CF0 subunit I of ATP synthase [Botryococcus braunii]
MIISISNFALLREMPFAEGIGFNGNILETNIINLAVVVGIVVSFGGDALRSLLESRRQAILSTLQQAEQKAKDAQDRLAEAKAQLEMSQKKAKEIREQGKISAERERSLLSKQAQEDITRLQESKQESIQLQQQKAVAQISQKVIALALEEVHTRLDQGLDETNHSSVVNFGLVQFANYKPITSL